MLIKVGEAIYALPILSLRESFKCSLDNITKTMDGLEVVTVREDVMPVIRLHEILGVKANKESLEEGIMIIIENRNKKVCLFAV